ncbi:MAG: hypothetical protein MJZ28_04300 [Paludibacteraceae bacterium]|nr:hypothetical protein [Paludibacteraceae bacterium]
MILRFQYLSHSAYDGYFVIVYLAIFVVTILYYVIKDRYWEYRRLGKNNASGSTMLTRGQEAFAQVLGAILVGNSASDRSLQEVYSFLSKYYSAHIVNMILNDIKICMNPINQARIVSDVHSFDKSLEIVFNEYERSTHRKKILKFLNDICVIDNVDPKENVFLQKVVYAFSNPKEYIIGGCGNLK